MAKFFNYFPKTIYSANNKTSGLDTVTNIIARVGFENTLKENSATFYEYNIQDSDTPEIIAAKYYDNPERHWIVLMFNDIIDPQYDWPLQYNTFIKYVTEKYSANGAANTTVQNGLAWAMSTNNVHSYYKIITKTNSDGISTTQKFEVDANTYSNIAVSSTNYLLQDGSSITESVSKETKTFYDYENELNEEKRTIKLLKPEFVSQVEKEFKRVIKG